MVIQTHRRGFMHRERPESPVNEAVPSKQRRQLFNTSDPVPDIGPDRQSVAYAGLPAHATDLAQTEARGCPDRTLAGAGHQYRHPEESFIGTSLVGKEGQPGEHHATG